MHSAREMKLYFPDLASYHPAFLVASLQLIPLCNVRSQYLGNLHLQMVFSQRDSSHPSENWDSDLLFSAMPSSDFSDALPSPQYTPDSITKRRRHGEYFHRPPVCFSHSRSHSTYLPVSPGSSPLALEENSVDQPCVVCPSCRAGLDVSFTRHNNLVSSPAIVKENTRYISDREPHVFGDVAPTSVRSRNVTVNELEKNLSKQVGLPQSADTTHLAVSEENENKCPDTTLCKQSMTELVSPASRGDNIFAPLATCKMADAFHQPKAALCTMLQCYRDIRCANGQRWSIQQDSLVLGVNPALVHIEPDHQLPDMHELNPGKLYVVCRMYADMWALCVEVSIDIPSPLDLPVPNLGVRLAFLPLCAVTLAANLAPFMERCRRYNSNPGTESLYPGNGQRVVAPARVESLNASLQLTRHAQGPSILRLSLSEMIQQAYTNFTLLDKPEIEYVPLDSTLEKLFSGISKSAKDASVVWKNLAGNRLWASFKPPLRNATPDNLETSLKRNVPQYPSCLLPIKNTRTFQEQHQPRRSLRQQRSSFSISESLRSLFGRSESREDSITQLIQGGNAVKLKE